MVAPHLAQPGMEALSTVSQPMINAPIVAALIALLGVLVAQMVTIFQNRRQHQRWQIEQTQLQKHRQLEQIRDRVRWAAELAIS